MGGFLLLTAIFGLLMLVVQRAELKRRIVTALFMLIVGVLVWRYGIYRIGGDCGTLDWPALCQTRVIGRLNGAIAITTVNRALIAAVLLNLVYWALFGRYNPVGSSDSIKVIGLYDEA